MKYIPKAPIARIIHDAGAEKVSEGLVEEIGDAMERMAFVMAKKAIVVARFREDIIVRRKHLQSALSIEKKDKE
ncbi:MAG: histone-like protein [Candidatus Marinimicrobia bacterium]|nr:histone-like protein [Candidatus Neomarinimicrobiota bacterium]